MKLNNFKGFHCLSIEESIEKLLSETIGLTSSEANLRHEQYGPNRLPEVPPPGIFAIFIDQLNSPIVYLLFVASCASFFFKDYTEAVAILLVIVVNAVIGFIMEYQAIRSMEALRKLDLVNVKVFRDGVLSTVNADLLVPGDLIFVESGDIIPADARLIQAIDLEVDESPLTGESIPVEKVTDTLPSDTIEADRINMLFKGTATTKGNGKALVTGIGKDTELGKIAEMVSTSEQEETPLNKKLEGFSKKLIWLVAAITFPFLLVGIWQQREMHLMIETAIALAVAAIPEGLPIVATIALAKGMLNLAKKQVLIKKLAAVETLGSANIVLTDKTGTLTENKLTIHKILVDESTELGTVWSDAGKNVKLNPSQLSKESMDGFRKLLEIATLCNNAVYHERNEIELGDPLEISLLKFAAAYDPDSYRQLLDKATKEDEIPFDSDSKIMGVLYKTDYGFSVASKGAVESILDHCSQILKDGKVQALTNERKRELLKTSDKIASQGMKVLGYCYKDVAEKEEDFLEDLIFVGITGFLDPPREDIRSSLSECKDAGIKVVMITGDHFETAKEISRQVGLSNSDSEITGIKGRELNEMDLSDPSDKNRLESAVFFSRVTPAQKQNLVNFYQQIGYVVGMTGDGINDAPALKKADIGVAMGIRGTQVAREAADMILKDDSFSSIVVAIRQGRVIYNNVKYFIIYLLSCNLSEIMIVAIAAFSNLVLPLIPLQILFLNLVTDVFPALALGMGKGGPNIMKHPPRLINEPLITKKNWISITAYSMVITLTVFAGWRDCLC